MELFLFPLPQLPGDSPFGHFQMKVYCNDFTNVASVSHVQCTLSQTSFSQMFVEVKRFSESERKGLHFLGHSQAHPQP